MTAIRQDEILPPIAGGIIGVLLGWIFAYVLCTRFSLPLGITFGLLMIAFAIVGASVAKHLYDRK